ncbi:MAG: hypothetical protein AVDCRST_MAG48-1935, partial [uncultured Friedmanniella sp.]
ATSAATGAPPRGRARTATGTPRRWLRHPTSCRPASTRSANISTLLQRLSRPA